MGEVLGTESSSRKTVSAGVVDDPYDLNIPDDPSESRAVQSQLFF